MPVYRYICSSCGQQQDLKRGVHDAEISLCPLCHTAALKRVFGAVGVQFSGSGFYATDYQQCSGPCPSSCSCSKKNCGS